MTERTVAKISLEDDAISLTSTQASENGGIFTVDRILVERENHYKRYLIKWEDYPLEESTWEPRRSIKDPSILVSWEKRKEDEKCGRARPFNLVAFNKKVAKHEAKTNERHRLRRAKRNRLVALESRPDTTLSVNDTAKDAAVINPDPQRDKCLRVGKINSSGTKGNTGCRQAKKRHGDGADISSSVPSGNKEPSSSASHRAYANGHSRQLEQASASGSKCTFEWN